MSSSNVELLAARYLTKFLEQGSKISLKKFMYKIPVKGKKRKRVQSLLYNVVAYLNVIDKALDNAIMKLNISCSLDPKDRNLLRILTYRLLFQNLSLDLLTERINVIKNNEIKAILSNIKFPAPKDDIESISLKLSFPEWMIKRLLNYLPKDFLATMLSAFNKRPKTWVVVNLLRASKDEVIEALENDGFEVLEDKDFSEVLQITRFSKRLEKSKAYREKLILPMSKASAAVVKVLNPNSDDVILDACAAPGNKTIFASFLMNNSGRIYAIDINHARLERMRSLLHSYGIKNVTLIHGDARKYRPETEVNKVLIDAPCTSSGMIGLNPDIKWRISYNDVIKFSKLQREILENFLSLLAKNHSYEIVYSTCSFFPEENEILISRILGSFPNLKKADISSIGSNDYFNGMYGRRFFPHIHDTIALFVTKLVKKNN